MSFIQSQIKLVLFLIAISLVVSCGKNNPERNQTFLVSEENLRWMPNFEKYKVFHMVDNNLITNTFTFQYKNFYFNESSTTRFGFGVKQTKRECLEVYYNSYLNSNFKISLQANQPELGDEISINFSRFYVTYNFKKKKIERMYIDNLNEGVFFQSSESIINSKFDYYDSLSINSVNYYELMKFELRDTPIVFLPSTITEFVIAKELGLIMYKVHDGTIWNRKMD